MEKNVAPKKKIFKKEVFIGILFIAILAIAVSILTFGYLKNDKTLQKLQYLEKEAFSIKKSREQIWNEEKIIAEKKYHLNLEIYNFNKRRNNFAKTNFGIANAERLPITINPYKIDNSVWKKEAP